MYINSTILTAYSLRCKIFHVIVVKDKIDFYSSKNLSVQKIISDFKNKFSHSDNKIFCSVAPARVNLIGDHIDYNGGFVFPCAINLYMTLAIRKNTRKKFSYCTVSLGEVFEFELEALKSAGSFSYDKAFSFANYLNGALKFLVEKGAKIDSGFDVLIYSNIPIGSGLSSSAALETAFILAVSTIFGFEMSREEIAILGKRIENEFLGLQSGIMDQFIVANAKAKTAMLLDTATLKYQLFPLELGSYSLVVMNSCKPRSLISSKYNERKFECEMLLSILQNHPKTKSVKNLCELTENDLASAKKIIDSSQILQDKFQLIKTPNTIDFESYKQLLYRRLRHCIMENIFVQEAAIALKQNALEQFGSLLTRSHNSLKNDYEVSGNELDTLVELANKVDGCLGARMTGAGFSGCAIAIVKSTNLESFFMQVQKGYEEKCNLICEFYVCNIEEGVNIYEF